MAAYMQAHKGRQHHAENGGIDRHLRLGSTQAGICGHGSMQAMNLQGHSLQVSDNLPPMQWQQQSDLQWDTANAACVRP